MTDQKWKRLILWIWCQCIDRFAKSSLPPISTMWLQNAIFFLPPMLWKRLATLYCSLLGAALGASCLLLFINMVSSVHSFLSFNIIGNWFSPVILGFLCLYNTLWLSGSESYQFHLALWSSVQAAQMRCRQLPPSPSARSCHCISGWQCSASLLILIAMCTVWKGCSSFGTRQQAATLMPSDLEVPLLMDFRGPYLAVVPMPWHRLCCNPATARGGQCQRHWKGCWHCLFGKFQCSSSSSSCL